MNRPLSQAWGQFLSQVLVGLVRDSHVSGLGEVISGTQAVWVLRSRSRRGGRTADLLVPG
jgi:hypothetical protein